MRRQAGEAAVGRISELCADQLWPAAVDDDGACSASTITTSPPPLNWAAALRKLSIVSSKWRIAATAPVGPAIGVVFAITHSPVCGETYGGDW